jgi:hypothetical protein
MNLPGYGNAMLHGMVGVLHGPSSASAASASIHMQFNHQHDHQSIMRFKCVKLGPLKATDPHAAGSAREHLLADMLVAMIGKMHVSDWPSMA